MATHSSILAWKISWTEKLGGLQPMGLQRVGHDGAANATTTVSGSPLYLACASDKARGHSWPSDHLLTFYLL